MNQNGIYRDTFNIGQVLYARIRSINNRDSSAWSASYNWKTITIGDPSVYMAPNRGQTEVDPLIIFNYSSAFVGLDSLAIRIDTLPDFQTPYIKRTGWPSLNQPKTTADLSRF